MISFARQDLILRPIEKRLYLFADERSEGENNYQIYYISKHTHPEIVLSFEPRHEKPGFLPMRKQRST